MQKKCSICLIEKSLDGFYMMKSRNNRLHSECIECARIKAKLHQKKYYLKNRKKLLEKKVFYNINNKEKIHLRYCRNKEKTNIKIKHRRVSDISYKIKMNLSCRMRMAIKNGHKKSKSLELLGCDIEFFKKYFSNKFTKGMSWDIFLTGKIHIDHIIPCSRFDLTKLDQQKQCFHYTNLQPLWAVDNLKKMTKVYNSQLKIAI